MTKKIKAANGKGFHIYRAQSGQFYWLYIAGNGRVIARSSENYKRKSSMLLSMVRMVTGLDGLIKAIYDHTKPGVPISVKR